MAFTYVSNLELDVISWPKNLQREVQTRFEAGIEFDIVFQDQGGA